MATWDWKAEGFARAPTSRWSKPGEQLYRAWGGRSQMRGSATRPGVCFSTAAPSTRLEAEKLFAVLEWGNAVSHLTEFLVPVGTLLWIAPIAPGDPRAVLGAFAGTQVFVENPAAQKLTPIRTTPLADDLRGAWVYTGRGPRIDS